LWVKYYVNGRPIRQSTGTTSKQEATRFLNRRLGKASEGELVVPRLDRIRYEEIAKDLREHYRATGRRDLRETESRSKHLRSILHGPARRADYVLAHHVLRRWTSGRQPAGSERDHQPGTRDTEPNAAPRLRRREGAATPEDRVPHGGPAAPIATTPCVGIWHLILRS
jgi:hypothetical protein